MTSWVQVAQELAGSVDSPLVFCPVAVWGSAVWVIKSQARTDRAVALLEAIANFRNRPKGHAVKKGR